MHQKGLVKTVKFKQPKYVGDPINAVKVFNEKEVDELIVLDIDASVDNREPDYRLIENLAVECRMPLCYGGGVKTVEQAERIVKLGVEKVALSSILSKNPRLVSHIADKIGSQSVVAVLDVKKHRIRNRYEVMVSRGGKGTGRSPSEFAAELQKLGVGEIVVNSISRDGTMSGYDTELVDQVYNSISVPITVLGGAGSLDDISRLISRYQLIGAAVGSLFVFKGKYRAVLISYPNRENKKKLLSSAGF